MERDNCDLVILKITGMGYNVEEGVMMMEKNSISKTLVNLRNGKGLTQKELAAELNYSDKVISKWERGESIPNVVTLEQIASFYGITIDDLISSKVAIEDEGESIKQLVVKQTQGPSLLTKLSILIPTVFFLLTIGRSPMLFFIAGFVLIVLLIIYGIVIIYVTFESEYQGHTIKVINRPLGLKLFIDNKEVDGNTSLFAFQVSMSGKVGNELIKVRISANLFVKCTIYVE